MQPQPIEQWTLSNGLRVAVAPSDSPGVAVNLWYEVGSTDEAPQRTGFAHLFEHLMFQGSANVAPGEHMALVEKAGGRVNATTSQDRTNYFETIPRGALELALWLEADRMATLSITEANFEAQRNVVKEEKRERYDNQPYGDLLELLTAQHFPPDHPYGHLTIGSMEHLDQARLADVASFFDSWYRPSNARLVLAGNVSIEDGFALVERYFGHLPASPAPKPRQTIETPLNAPGRHEVARDVPYSVGYLSWATTPAADPLLPALDLALMILADGQASRLHKEIVKRRALAQETHALHLTHRRAASVATLMARPVSGGDPRAATEAILESLARFVDEGPTQPEFDRALAQTERGWLWQLATAEDRADALNEAWLLHGSPEAVNDELARTLALTPDDVCAAAARWLHPDHAHELLYLKEA